MDYFAHSLQLVGTHHSEPVTVDEDPLEDTIFCSMAETDPPRPNATYQILSSLTVLIWILQAFFSLLVELCFNEDTKAMRIGNSSA